MQVLLRLGLECIRLIVPSAEQVCEQLAASDLLSCKGHHVSYLIRVLSSWHVRLTLVEDEWDRDDGPLVCRQAAIQDAQDRAAHDETLGRRAEADRRGLALVKAGSIGHLPPQRNTTTLSIDGVAPVAWVLSLDRRRDRAGREEWQAGHDDAEQGKDEVDCEVEEDHEQD